MGLEHAVLMTAINQKLEDDQREKDLFYFRLWRDGGNEAVERHKRAIAAARREKERREDPARGCQICTSKAKCGTCAYRPD
jgi:hypothetical protein